MKLDITTLPTKAEEFFSYLKNQIGYMDSTPTNIRRILFNHFIPIVEKVGGDIELAYDEYIENLKNSNTSQRRQKICNSTVYRFIMFLKDEKYELQPIFPKYEKPKLLYLEDSLNDYLLSCVTNKPITIEQKSRHLLKFLSYLENRGIKMCNDITIDYVTQFLNEQIGKNYHGTARGYLSYLYDTGKLDNPIHLLISNPKGKKPVPSVYRLEELEIIDKGFNRKTNTGLRNYCVFLLASELGMRISDIVNLKYENIDFLNKVVSFIQIKTGLEMKLPLSDKFIDLLKLYIKNYRTDSLPFLFVTVLPPIRPISTSVIRFHLGREMTKIGIQYNGRKHGPHSFRSSLVSNMINNEVPYEVVRKVVGHTSETALKHYAKIDIEKLRIFALEPIDFGEGIEAMLEGELDV